MRLGLVLVLFAFACGQNAENPPTPDMAAPQQDMGMQDFAQPVLCHDNEVGDAGLPPTFANVQRVFDFSCTACHCCGDPMDLTDGKSYAQIVNRSPPPMSDKSTNESCGGTLVTPGDPAHSYLYQKISVNPPCAGQPMPLQEFQFVPLPQCAQDVIKRWIEAGAPNN